MRFSIKLRFHISFQLMRRQDLCKGNYRIRNNDKERRSVFFINRKYSAATNQNNHGCNQQGHFCNESTYLSLKSQNILSFRFWSIFPVMMLLWWCLWSVFQRSQMMRKYIPNSAMVNARPIDLFISSFILVLLYLVCPRVFISFGW